MTSSGITDSTEDLSQGRFAWLKHLWEAKYLLLWVSLLTLATEWAGCFKGSETAALDVLISVFTEPRRAPHVIIVGIQDQDYQEIFEATSPLKPQRVHDLIHAISLSNPRVIGIDLDTSATQFNGFQNEPRWPPVIWARGATQITEEKGFTIKLMESLKGMLKPFIKERNQSVFQTADMLGEHKNEPNLLSGIALLPQDGDGLIRRYWRVFNTVEPEASTDKPSITDSFPWAIVQAYCRNTAKKPNECTEVTPTYGGNQTEEELVLNFAGDRYRFERIDATEVLKLARTDAWQKDGLLKDKIVLLGGFYRAARDEYVTPVGPMAGVELMGQAIESDLEGTGIRAANHLLMFLMEILVGIGLVYVHYRFKSSTLVFFAIPPLLLLGSFIAFKSLAYWASYVPILFAVRMHKNYTHRKEDRELREELDKYQKRYGQLDEITPTREAIAIHEQDTNSVKESSNP